jgi:hypothetical protein
MGKTKGKDKLFTNSIKPDITIKEFEKTVEITEPVKKFIDIVVFVDYITNSVLGRYPEFEKLVQNEWNELRVNNEMLEIIKRLTKLLKIK